MSVISINNNFPWREIITDTRPQTTMLIFQAISTLKFFTFLDFQILSFMEFARGDTSFENRNLPLANIIS